MITWPGLPRDRSCALMRAVAPGLAVLAALVVQVCRPGGADLAVGVTAPLVVLAVATGRLGRGARLFVSASLIVQAAVHVGCAVGIAPLPLHGAASGWHLLVAAFSVLLVHAGERSLAATLVRSLAWTSCLGGAATVVARCTRAVLARTRWLHGHVGTADASGRAPPLRGAPAPA